MIHILEMNKRLFFLALLPMMGFAGNAIYTADPDTAPKGIVILPLNKIQDSPNALNEIKEQKKKGYLYKENTFAIKMIKDSQSRYHDLINDIDDPKDTHMKSDIKRIKLGFNFYPLSFIQSIGYAAGGAYIDGKGWTNVSTYFRDKEIGVCEYEVNSMELSRGAVIIPQENISYEINNKVSYISVEGSPKSGFVYFINWNDDSYNYTLKCANMKYDDAITFKGIQLAKKIDRNGNGLIRN